MDPLDQFLGIYARFYHCLGYHCFAFIQISPEIALELNIGRWTEDKFFKGNFLSVTDFLKVYALIIIFLFQILERLERIDRRILINAISMILGEIFHIGINISNKFGGGEPSRKYLFEPFFVLVNDKVNNIANNQEIFEDYFCIQVF